MGDRISISFKNKKSESVVLFNHWGGREFLGVVKDYLKEIGEYDKNIIQTPFNRREPETIMVDFIRWLTKDEKRIDSTIYLGKDQEDGDNSDNGHFTINLETGEIE